MTGELRGWLLAIISASILCALADSLMPAGGVKRVGRLVFGLVILCAILSPFSQLDLEGGRLWLEDYLAGLEEQEEQLKEQVDGGIKVIIEEECAAYIVDKAAQLGLTCTARVTCRGEADGLFVPETTQVAGALTDVEQSRLTQIIQEDLGVPPERQTYYSEGELP